MNIYRYPGNPIIEPKDIPPYLEDYEVIGVFNAGVMRYGDEILLLLRIAERPVHHDPKYSLSPFYDMANGKMGVVRLEKGMPGYDFSDARGIGTPDGSLLTSISYLRIARSKDGIHFKIDDRPALFPENRYEIYGIEDCRITQIDDTYYINYSAVSNLGITTCLASTKDFAYMQREGVIFQPDSKNIAIFPQKINGKYYALHRPSSSSFGKPSMWIAESPDLLCWGNHRYLMGCRDGCWDETRIGASCVPIKLEQGWLELYHGADRNNRYCLGAALLDIDQPWRVIARSTLPLMEPETAYEKDGFFGNVIFSCGALYEQGKVRIYYGAADTSMCYAEVDMAEIMRGMKECEGLSGK
ncbi:glycoside hydrolase family 130 protein [Paenibacillus ehimensis]|uniref:Glycoside hydrolase family 130 protein n=1 Tax=Paenibacillus ehimensis TaxID=79264 RepID=A0ABT8V6T8_9BACL|nr:glycoside hydrolase family 130 protein [Paenibacillus ehimensis]MDO3677153.1 glycoside hydrolase family 130 protein [Paenibacillus ehimensis]